MNQAPFNIPNFALLGRALLGIAGQRKIVSVPSLLPNMPVSYTHQSRQDGAFQFRSDPIDARGRGPPRRWMPPGRSDSTSASTIPTSVRAAVQVQHQLPHTDETGQARSFTGSIIRRLAFYDGL